MSDLQRRAGMFRRGRNDIENHIVDEYAAGRIDRREFIRRGTVAGLSLPMISLLIAACGGANDTSSSSSAAAGTGGAASTAAAGKPGGTMRLGITTPSTEVDPVLNGDTGGLAMLAHDRRVPRGRREQAADAVAGRVVDVERRRQRVDVQDPPGRQLQRRHADDGEGRRRVDQPPVRPGQQVERAVGVHGRAVEGQRHGARTTRPSCSSSTRPNGSFPYYLSSDNYNAIILPAAYAGDFTKTFPGTGPWKLDVVHRRVRRRRSFRNDGYWGKKPLPAKLDITFAADEGAQILALQGGQLDVVQQVSVSGAQAILNDPAYNIITLQSSAHRQLSMRTDKKPFDDARVRQAIALSIDRKGIVDGLFQGKSDLGNDSPFAPVFAQTDTTVAQRAQDVAKAKQLLSDAGVANGFSTELVANQTQEIPEYAQIVVDAAKAIGVNIKLKLEDANTYYGEAVYGKSHWLDSVMSLVDYGHRGVPNVFLSAPLLSDGTWNAAHYKNPDYDKMVKDYIAAVDLQTPAEAGRRDPAEAARRHADHLRLLLQLPDAHARRGDGRPHHGHEPRLGRPVDPARLTTYGSGPGGDGRRARAHRPPCSASSSAGSVSD